MYRDHRSSVARAVYSPDGRIIVTVANDGTARVWYARASELKEEARRRMPQRLIPAKKGSVTI